MADGVTGNWPVAVPEGYRVGPYLVGAGIAAGSWGCVYAASLVDDPSETQAAASTGHWPATAALKFLPTGRLTPGQRGMMRELVDREIRFGTEVVGRYLVRIDAVLDVVDPDHAELDGCVVLVMERAERNLREVLDGGEAGTPIAGAPRMLVELAEALDGLHAQGWVHADIKPENLLVMPDGVLRVGDFGLSAEMEGTHAYVPNLGSTDYLPPEWWHEQLAVRGVAVRPAGDVWAFGVVAHELLTGGQHPFPGATSRARSAAVREAAAGGGEVRINPRLAAPWRDLVLDCLAFDPAERMERVGDLAERARGLAEAPLLEPAAGVDEADEAEEAEEAGAALVDGVATGRRSAPTANDSNDGAGRRPRRTRIAWLAASLAVLLLGVAGGLWWAADTGGSADPSAEPSAGQAGPGESPSGSAMVRPRSAGQGDTPLPGALRADAAVPREYRDAIDLAGRTCRDRPLVTPALIAAMLAAESEFNPRKRSPETGEYGIALWTPHLLRQWVPNADPMNPRHSIKALGLYLCWADGQLAGEPGLKPNDPRLLAAAYRSSTDLVIKSGGVPAKVAEYVARVEAKRREFAER